MSEPASSNLSPKLWAALIGGIVALVTAAGAFVTLLLGVIALAGYLVSYGGWKTGVDQQLAAHTAEIAAVKAADKEQFTTLSSTTDKQIVAVTAACKEMVTNATDGLRKSIEDIERDRKTHISDADHWREEKGGEITELKTIATNQQKQIDLLTEGNARRAATR